MLYKRIVPHELRTFIKRIPKDFDPSQTLSRYTVQRALLCRSALYAHRCSWLSGARGSAGTNTLFGCSLLRSRCVSFRSAKTAEVIGTIISEKLMADALDDKVGQQTTDNRQRRFSLRSMYRFGHSRTRVTVFRHH